MTPPDQRSSTAPTDRGEPSGGSMIGIGEAARILDREFGGVTVSKIRYLESRGLVTPTRTRGGSRRYTQTDLDLLRRIIDSQHREFLPLDVIAQRLAEGVAPDDAKDHGAASDAPRRSSSTTPYPDGGCVASVLRPRPDPEASVELSPEQFIKRSGCTSEMIEQMRQHGLITRWNTSELTICQVVIRMHQYGIEPRHLRWLAQSAERTTSLVDASLPIRYGAGPNAEAETDEERRHLAADLITTQLLLIRNALSQS